MADPEAQARKRVLRAQARAAEPVPRDPKRADAALARLLGLAELVGAGTVSLFAASAHEIPVERLLAALAPRRAVFPRVVDERIELHEVRGLDGLRPGFAGLLEPAGDAPRVAAAEVDAFVVPGLRFDRRGARLGRGAGHYDRLLAGARPDALRIGTCYSDQVVEALPEASWDVCMHVVVTDQEVLHCARPPEVAR